jgi:hypothetical protein
MNGDVTTSVSTDQNNPVVLKWADINNEKSRTYTFPTGSVTVLHPVKLNVKRKPEGDSHRLIDAAGISYYIPAGWLMLSWEGKDGTTFSF